MSIACWILMDMLWHVSLPFQCINEHRAAFLVITQSLCHTKMPAELQREAKAGLSPSIRYPRGWGKTLLLPQLPGY